MNDEALRALVRELVQRRLAERSGSGAAPPARPPATAVHVGPSLQGSHASHDIYLTLVNTGDVCVIEPAVPCTHCDYCRSHGH